ncbi:MAG TPA: hypothetical protein ENI82_00950 [Bacteroidetes bacterium]|nr:hypothetical protein [Bacteroidota bacterium]
MDIKTGDYVVVKPDSIKGDFDFNGAGGRVQRIFKNGAIQVVWDSITLKRFTDDYIKYMIAKEYYLFDYNFAEDQIIKTEPRDTLEEMYAAQEELYNRKLNLTDKKISQIEEYYDRFVLSPYYEKLTDIQKDKSWDIINIFSSIIVEQYELQPSGWDEEAFHYVYNYFPDRVVASKGLFKSGKRVLMQYLKFLDYKGFCDTKKMQAYLKKQKTWE